MTISYNLAPIPKWYIADRSGRPLGGGYMKTFHSLNKTQQKFIYQDAGGNFPWPNPTLFDENGSQGPFYWETDTNNATDLYYIEVYDSAGNLQWTIDSFTPPGSGGGSSTTAVDLENLIINNIFWRNTGNSSPVALYKGICAGAKEGLTNVFNDGLISPPTITSDIAFIKNNTNSTDTYSFVDFILGDNPLTGDACPLYYFNYSCTNIGAGGETLKSIIIPINSKLQTLSNQPFTLTIWARCNSGNNELSLQLYNYYGDGGSPTTNSIDTVATLELTDSWDKYQVQGTVSDFSSDTLGDCGNDALYLLISFPLSQISDIDICKPCLYTGSIAPEIDFHSYDQIDSMMNMPRTGDVKISFTNITYPPWLPMDDGTIGSPSSGATTRANTDCFPLYNTLWNYISDTYAPVTGGRGVNAVADFTADKPIALTKVLGRSLAGIGTPSIGGTNWELGQISGLETETLTSANQLPPHSHALNGSVTASGSVPNGAYVTDQNDAGLPHVDLQGPGAENLVTRTVINVSVNNTLSIGSTGSSSSFSILQPTNHLNVLIRL